MWKKLSKILMAAIIFVSGVVLIPTVKASAVGVDTVVKAVGGKAVVRSLAEEAGMMLAPKQLDNVVKVLERKTFDGDPKAIDFMNKANQVIDMPSSEPASKSGFKKYVLDPALWISGLDLIFDAVDAFQDGYDSGNPVDSVKQGGGYAVTWYPMDNGGSNWYPQFRVSDGTTTYSGFGTSSLVSKTTYTQAQTYSMYPVFEYKIEYKTDRYYVWVKLRRTDNGGFDNVISYPNTAYAYTLSPSPDVLSQYAPVTVPVTSTDVVDISKVSPVTKTHFDNDTYDNDTTYNIEVEMPDNLTNYNYDNDTTVWNAPDPELELEISPPSPPDTIDPDPDGDDGKGDSIDVLVRVDDEIPIHEKFFLEMADMGQKVEDMYNGVVHFFDVTIDGFTTLTDGMTGFVAFLDNFFDWLPSEYVAILGSGFTLGVVSFFLRR